MNLATAVAAGPKKRGAKKQPKFNKDGTEKQPRKPTAYNAWMQGKVCSRACTSPPEPAGLPCARIAAISVQSYNAWMQGKVRRAGCSVCLFCLDLPCSAIWIRMLWHIHITPQHTFTAHNQLSDKNAFVLLSRIQHLDLQTDSAITYGGRRHLCTDHVSQQCTARCPSRNENAASQRVGSSRGSHKNSQFLV